MKKQQVAIIGAGPVGLSMALYLAKLDFIVKIYERRADFRQDLQTNWRSINLALSWRGIKTLQELEIWPKIASKAVKVYGRAVHLDDQIDYQMYSHRPNEYNYSVERKNLNIFLLNQAEKQPNIDVQFDCPIRINNLPDADWFIVADGASSHLRRQLQKIGKVQFEEKLSHHAYKEIFFPIAVGKMLTSNYLHIWPRHKFMLMALPNQDGSYTGTLFMPIHDFNKLNNDRAIRQFFKQYFPMVLEMIPDLLKQFVSHPVGRLKTVQGGPWWIEDKILLWGDAAHAMLPYLGQGLNCGLEGCRLLYNALMKKPQNFKATIANFWLKRKQDSDAITFMSAENYRQMCDEVINPVYLAKRKQEEKLAQADPTGFYNRYQKITYTDISYHEILAKDDN